MAEAMTIWKFPLALGRVTVCHVSAGSKIVLIANDPAETHPTPAIWIEHFPGSPAPNEDRYFQIVGTGHRVSLDMEHRGSVVSGDFVWHVYEPSAALRAKAEGEAHD